jgi:hypothetical protein
MKKDTNDSASSPRNDLGTSDLGTGRMLETFRFYEEASEKAKAHAWTQTAWILTLNAGVIAFSLNVYLQHSKDTNFRVIEIFSALVGIVLCGYLGYILDELGKHIRTYWTFSNKIAADLPPLVSFIGEVEVLKAKEPGDRAGFPKFCRRLQILAGLFGLAHILWLLFVFHL